MPSASAGATVQAEYPTWDEVLAARADEAAAGAQVDEIRGLLLQLETQLEAAQATEQAKGAAFERAQDAYDQQTLVASNLRAQANEAELDAEVAQRRAAVLISSISRSGGGDITTSLLVQGDAANLLYRLDVLQQLAEYSDQVYSRAALARNTALALTSQAEVAEATLEGLRGIAEVAFEEAQAATQEAAEVLEAQRVQQAQLEAQLSVLTEKREVTESDYQAGVQIRWGANAGQVSAAGWARPSAGYISSPFGMRYHPIYRVWRLHNGVDLAGQGCEAPIYASRGGTVTYAGANGTLGNYVQIDHGDGTSSGYGHIMPGGIHVAYGQRVDSGQPIAQVGTTGASTGCHLHFIVRVNGQVTDPVPYLRERGINLG